MACCSWTQIYNWGYLQLRREILVPFWWGEGTSIFSPVHVTVGHGKARATVLSVQE